MENIDKTVLVENCIEKIDEDAFSQLSYGRGHQTYVIDTFHELKDFPDLQKKIVTKLCWCFDGDNNYNQFNTLIELEPYMDDTMFNILKRTFQESWLYDEYDQIRHFNISSDRLKNLVFKKLLCSKNLKIAYETMINCRINPFTVEEINPDLLKIALYIRELN